MPIHACAGSLTLASLQFGAANRKGATPMGWSEIRGHAIDPTSSALRQTGRPCGGATPRAPAFTVLGSPVIVANQESDTLTIIAFNSEHSTLDKFATPFLISSANSSPS